MDEDLLQPVGENDIVAESPADADPVSDADLEPICDLELTIYTISGHKYTTELLFLSDVAAGRISEADARKQLKRINQHLRQKSFQRPISYSDTQDDGSLSEFLFNPANVECINMVRRFTPQDGK